MIKLENFLKLSERETQTLIELDLSNDKVGAYSESDWEKLGEKLKLCLKMVRINLNNNGLSQIHDTSWNHAVRAFNKAPALLNVIADLYPYQQNQLSSFLIPKIMNTAKTFKIDHEAITSLVVLKGDDANYIISGFEDGGIFVYSQELDEKVAHANPQHRTNAEVTSLAVISNQRLVSGFLDGYIRIWQYERRTSSLGFKLTHEASFKYSCDVTCLVSLPDGSFVAGFLDGSIRIFSLLSGYGLNCKTTLSVHTHAITSLVALPYDGVFASGSADGSIRIWGNGRGFFECEKTLQQGYHAINSLTVYQNKYTGYKLISGAMEHEINIWSSPQSSGDTWRFVGNLEDPQKNLNSHGVLSSSILPDGRIAISFDDGGIRIWKCSLIPDEMFIHELTLTTRDANLVYSLTVLPDGRLVGGCSDGSICVWNLGIYSTFTALSSNLIADTLVSAPAPAPAPAPALTAPFPAFFPSFNNTTSPSDITPSSVPKSYGNVGGQG